MKRATIVGMSIITALVAAAAAHARPRTERSGGQASPPAAPAKEGAIDPRADAVLRHMSSYLGNAKSLRFDTVTIDEKVATTGQKIQEVKESRVTLQRPNQLAVDRHGPAGHVLFRYDGKHFVVYGVDHNVYAQAPAPATLDAAIDEARDRLGIDAPGADLFAADAYQSLVDGVSEGRYIGFEPLDGVMTHHLAMRKGPIDYQLWIQDGPEPIPLRYVITSRDMQGQPQFTLELRHFQANVPLSDASFAFVPPPGAQQVAFSKQTSSHR